MSELMFYDHTPFQYGYSSEEEIINNMHPLLKKLMEENINKVFCDIGCGCGRNLVYASKIASRLIGVDLSVNSLDFARKFVKTDNLELIEGNNLSIPLADNMADLVISDGVCHHTGDTVKAFNECIRILKPNGKLYLAIYKKFRYYPFIYFSIGSIFRLIHKTRLGRSILEGIFIKIHYLMYKLLKKQKLSFSETRNIFFDYFITPIATFHSKADIYSWAYNINARIVDYDSTSGNCHIFIIKKSE